MTFQHLVSPQDDIACAYSGNMCISLKKVRISILFSSSIISSVDIDNISRFHAASRPVNVPGDVLPRGDNIGTLADSGNTAESMKKVRILILLVILTPHWWI